MVRTLIGVVVILLVTFLTSYTMSMYQNNLINQSNEYIQLIKEIPDNFGNWERISSKPLLPSEAEELKVRDAEYWTYKNKKTDEWVVISIFVGPTGRVGVHTPEICLSGSGYHLTENRVSETFKIDEHSQAGNMPEEKSNSDKSSDNTDSQQFWRVVISDEAAPDFQRVFYYALGTGKKWWALNNPRFELSSYPFIVKMQVETETEIANVNDYNVVREFLKDFLPIVTKIFDKTKLEETYGKK